MLCSKEKLFVLIPHLIPTSSIQCMFTTNELINNNSMYGGTTNIVTSLDLFAREQTSF